MSLIGFVTTPLSAQNAQDLVTGLGCAACHTGTRTSADEIRQRAPSLVGAQSRYDGAFLFDYFLNPPVTPSAGVARMPDFHLDSREALGLALLLSNGRADVGGDLARHFESAQDSFPNVDTGTGRQIFTALRCGACHESEFGTAPADAPDLSLSSRLQEEWLAGFLAQPHAVRPFGATPGTGSRMPDFRLEEGESARIASYLTQPNQSVRTFVRQNLTPYASDKALRLIRDKWSCLGCHSLDGVGGRIAPDLSGVGTRLTPGAIRSMILDPHGAVPGTIMPRRIIPSDRVDLAASYLSGRADSPQAEYLSLVDHAPREVSGGRSGADLYDRLCANCHGINGLADGYNARYLPVPPTRHADSAYTSLRPDDTLFDGIHVGGFMLNKSHLMPGFGQSLSTAEIRSLVAHIRDLCRCDGPAWSRRAGENR